jgi:NADH-quinone oxidoreductase subunit H
MHGSSQPMSGPGLIIVLQSCAAGRLLVSVAYISMPTARSGLPCRCAAGRTWSARGALFQSFADLLKFVFKEPVIPSGANKGVFLLAPLVTCTLALAPGR